MAHIFSSKLKYDKKCKELQMPIETLQQYVSTYLTKKYGLKSLVQQWAAAIVNSVHKYQSEDADVCLFSKCLANECDAEFRSVQDYVKTQVEEAFRMVIHDSHPNANEPLLLYQPSETEIQ